MRWWLLGEAPGQTAKLDFEALDLPAGRLALVLIQFQGRRTGQPPLRAVDDGGDDLQIVQQGAGRTGGFRFHRLPGFEKQLGLVENAFSDQG